jgi:hypothetical protein
MSFCAATNARTCFSQSDLLRRHVCDGLRLYRAGELNECSSNTDDCQGTKESLHI